MYQVPRQETTAGVGCTVLLIILAIATFWNGLLIWGGLELIDLAIGIEWTLGYWQATAIGLGLAMLSAPLVAALQGARR